LKKRNYYDSDDAISEFAGTFLSEFHFDYALRVLEITNLFSQKLFFKKK
jgi:hypothetical protein